MPERTTRDHIAEYQHQQAEIAEERLHPRDVHYSNEGTLPEVGHATTMTQAPTASEQGYGEHSDDKLQGLKSAPGIDTPNAVTFPEPPRGKRGT